MNWGEASVFFTDSTGANYHSAICDKSLEYKMNRTVFFTQKLEKNVASLELLST